MQSDNLGKTILPISRMVFEGAGRPFRLDTRSVEMALGPRDALVAVTLATICGSDLHTYCGRRSTPSPAVLGHEGVGHVVQLGAERDPALLGKRVTWTLADSCGHCAACNEWALPQKCERLFKYGHAAADERLGLNGCFASHLHLQDGTKIIPLPDVVTDAMAAPANCALATMVNVLDVLTDTHEEILIQGAGLLGIYGACLLQASGRRAHVVDPEPSRRELASIFGATATYATSASIPSQSIDAVIEVAGTPAVIAEGVRVLRPGGLYALAGLVHPESALELTGETFIRKCLTMIGLHNYAPAHLQRGIAFLEQHAAKYPWDRLVSSPHPLTALDAAFACAQDRRWARVAIAPGMTNASKLSP